MVERQRLPGTEAQQAAYTPVCGCPDEAGGRALTWKEMHVRCMQGKGDLESQF